MRWRRSRPSCAGASAPGAIPVAMDCTNIADTLDSPPVAPIASWRMPVRDVVGPRQRCSHPWAPRLSLQSLHRQGEERRYREVACARQRDLAEARSLSGSERSPKPPRSWSSKKLESRLDRDDLRKGRSRRPGNPLTALSPKQLAPALAHEGPYLASESTMNRWSAVTARARARCIGLAFHRVWRREWHRPQGRRIAVVLQSDNGKPMRGSTMLATPQLARPGGDADPSD